LIAHPSGVTNFMTLCRSFDALPVGGERLLF
jgi:hypothetical protein